MIRREMITHGSEETQTVASALGRLLEGGDVIALAGELGSGKTTFTKGLCRGLGLDDTRMVSSPTYVLEHIYPTRIPLHHYDVYRLDTVTEFLDLGFDERLDQGHILVVEWALKVETVLPPTRLLVELRWPQPATPDEDGFERRKISISGPAAAWEARLRRLDRAG